MAGEHCVRILHVSDLHARGARDGKRAWKRTHVLGDAWKRNLDELAADGHRFDVVAFTGDVADWGLAEEYQHATPFVEALLARLGVKRERFFVVPGNHDINRKIKRSAWARMREGIGGAPQQVSEWLADSGGVPFGFKAAWREAVLERESAFWAWVERDLNRPELLPGRSPHGRLGYLVSLQLGARPMHIVGLDSAWLAGDEADAERLWLTDDQIGLLCRDEHGLSLPGFRLALMHHPLTHLADAESAGRLLADTVDLVLRGHQHTPLAQIQNNPGHTVRELAAGCLYEGSRSNCFPNACQAIDVALDEHGRPLRYDIRFRAWSEHGHWYDDGALYREAKQGRLSWPITHTVNGLALQPPHPPQQPPTLQQPSPPSRAHLWRVPDLPPHYLTRQATIETIVRALLDGGGKVGISAASQGSTSADLTASTKIDRHGLHGMGGIGKSVLAAAVARHPAIAQRFVDGIFWLSVGQEPQLASLQAQLCQALGHTAAFDHMADGKQRLRDILADKAVLLILDDVWTPQHAGMLDVVGLRGCLLVTTRDREVLTWLDANDYPLDVLRPGESLAFLADWTERPVAALPIEAAKVANACGHLPVALAMIGALIRRRQSWADVLRLLENAKLAKLKGRIPGYDYHNVFEVIDVSVASLAAEPDGARARSCYVELAVFPEDTPIPRAALRIAWARHGLDQDDAEDLAGTLADRALASLDQTGRLTLHDLQRLYARSHVQDLAILHGALADAYLARRDHVAATHPSAPYAGLDDGYFFQRLPWHLAEAGRYDALAALLFDFDWLDVKLRATKNVTDLLADFTLLSASHDASREAMLVHDALRLSSHVLAGDARQLPGQLVGRLGCITHGNARIAALLAQTRSMTRYHWLRPVTPSLTPPGGPLLRTFTGHTDLVSAVAMTADGRRAISASGDGTLKLWDLEEGTELRSLTGHESIVSGVAMTPDGRRAISASRDGTLKLWDLELGLELRSLTAHESIVSAVAVTADGRHAVSASRDGTLKLWDLEQGSELRSLVGHRGGVWAVAVIPGGQYAVSASDDCTLKLWDLEQGLELRTLAGHAGTVLAVAVTPDGKSAVSASTDGSVKLWDLEQGMAVRTLDGHSGWVTAVAVTPDGKSAVSASDDQTVKLWDLEQGADLRTLIGHTSAVRAVAVTADGRRAISASDDRTVKLWDLEQDMEVRTPASHAGPVRVVMILPDERRAISASRGGTVKLWDLEQGTGLRILIGHTGWVRSMSISPDGRRAVAASDVGTLTLLDLEQGTKPRMLANYADWVESIGVTRDGLRAVSTSDDFTLKIWDLETCTELRTLAGHANWVRAVAVSPDGGRAVSASDDFTLKLWDLEQGSELCTLSGHANWVLAVAVSSDGRRAVSGSADNTLKLWDLEQASELCTMTGHTGIVLAVAMTPDGKRAISTSDDHSLKVWDLGTGKCLVTFTTDGAMTACACSADATVIVAGDMQGGIHVLKLVELG